MFKIVGLLTFLFKVFSPITGEIIGREEIRVSKNKESIVGMDVKVLSGLHMDILTDNSGQRGLYKARTTYSKKLTTKYQVSYGAQN